MSIKQLRKLYIHTPHLECHWNTSTIPVSIITAHYDRVIIIDMQRNVTACIVFKYCCDATRTYTHCCLNSYCAINHEIRTRYGRFIGGQPSTHNRPSIFHSQFYFTVKCVLCLNIKIAKRLQRSCYLLMRVDHSSLWLTPYFEIIDVCVRDYEIRKSMRCTVMFFRIYLRLFKFHI